MGKILDSAKRTADLLGGISESVNNNSSNIDSLENKCDNIESNLSSRCDDLESDLQNTSDELTSQVESISVNTVKVVSNYPQTEKGTHLVMDDDGLKAVTTWDEERGYRRLIYNRDPVVYVESLLSNNIIQINGEEVNLQKGSNYIEVGELSKGTYFNSDTESYLYSIIIRTKISPNLFNIWDSSSGFINNLKSNYIELPIDNTVLSTRLLLYHNNILRWINCKEWDTSSVTNMVNMFTGCNGLTSLDLSNFDTSKVTNMNSIFSYCSSLTSLDLSDFDTSSVTGMSSMFHGCNRLTSLDLSNFDTSKVTSMSYMFYGCNRLTSLDLSNFDTSSVTNMSYMFYGCSSLTSLDLSNFDTSKVTSMDNMFCGCSSLTSLDLSNFDTSKVTSMDNMFRDYSSLTSLDLSSFDTSKVKSMGDMFCGCSSLTSLDLSNFDTSSVTNMNLMFTDCSSLTSLDLSNFNISSVIYVGWMFRRCSSLKSLIFPGMGNSPNPKISSIDLSSSPLDHDSLMSIFTYDRTENGLGTLTVSLSDISKNILSEEEISSITSKGYTIA